MPEWKKICCASDFSEPSRLALEQSAELARRFAGDLVLVHVYDAQRAAATSLIPPAEQALVATRELQEKLEAWRREAELLAGRPVEAKLLIGEPAAELVRFAGDALVELIVMGTHGRGRLKRLVLGSVAEQVVRKAPCPVLVTRHLVSLRSD